MLKNKYSGDCDPDTTDTARSGGVLFSPNVSEDYTGQSSQAVKNHGAQRNEYVHSEENYNLQQSRYNQHPQMTRPEYYNDQRPTESLHNHPISPNQPFQNPSTRLNRQNSQGTLYPDQYHPQNSYRPSQPDYSAPPLPPKNQSSPQQFNMNGVSGPKYRTPPPYRPPPPTGPMRSCNNSNSSLPHNIQQNPSNPPFSQNVSNYNSGAVRQPPPSMRNNNPAQLMHSNSPSHEAFSGPPVGRRQSSFSEEASMSSSFNEPRDLGIPLAPSPLHRSTSHGEAAALTPLRASGRNSLSDWIFSCICSSIIDPLLFIRGVGISNFS